MQVKDRIAKAKSMMKSNLCQCRGCKISRDPKSGYQPCIKSKVGNMNPPGAD